MSDNEQRAVAAYVAGRIEVEELEEALDHIHAGRTGGLPYLSPFRDPSVPENGKLLPPPRPRDAARSAQPRWARPWLG